MLRPVASSTNVTVSLMRPSALKHGLELQSIELRSEAISRSDKFHCFANKRAALVDCSWATESFSLITYIRSTSRAIARAIPSFPLTDENWFR